MTIPITKTPLLPFANQVSECNPSYRSERAIPFDHSERSNSNTPVPPQIKSRPPSTSLSVGQHEQHLQSFHQEAKEDPVKFFAELLSSYTDGMLIDFDRSLHGIAFKI